MSTYKAPLADIRFALFDVIGAEAEFARLGFADATRDVLDAVLDEAARFTETVLAPLNATGDREGCTLDRCRAPAGGSYPLAARRRPMAPIPRWAST